jgi:hydroxymethylglutaryl-CoA reductase (NADPH)
MPISKDEAGEVIRRIRQMGSLEDLSKRLEPVGEDQRPIPSEVPEAREWSSDAQAARLAWLESRGIELPHLAGRARAIDPAELRGNIEQFIGMTQVPTGLMGPLRINGLHAHGDFYVPLATSEGTLVASYDRGARLSTYAGGVSTLVTAEHVQRAPAFIFEKLVDAATFVAWATENFERFCEVAATRTRHGRLLDLQAHIEANHVYLIFSYHTADAAGQNMVTLCTAAICEEILASTPVQPESWFLEANMSGDKKATVLSFLHVRGRNALAEVELPRKLIEDGLRTTPEKMAEFWRVSFVGGSESGSIGVSGHIANGLAALFLACGQDVACVSEASVGITRMEVTRRGSLYCGVTLPNLIVGTVGGGTRLPTQRECLRILGCEGAAEGESRGTKLAEICAAVALAGEVSIVGAICAGEFAQAHKKLGRPGGS